MYLCTMYMYVHVCIYIYIYIVLTLRYQSNHQRINDNMRKKSDTSCQHKSVSGLQKPHTRASKCTFYTSRGSPHRVEPPE